MTNLEKSQYLKNNHEKVVAAFSKSYVKGYKAGMPSRRYIYDVAAEAIVTEDHADMTHILLPVSDSQISLGILTNGDARGCHLPWHFRKRKKMCSDIVTLYQSLYEADYQLNRDIIR